MKGLPIPRCRPRIEGDREGEILDATTAVLVESGYDRLTLDAVAAAAHVSKATLYRRWAGKADLVVDAVSHGCSAFEDAVGRPVDTGNLRSDLLELSRCLSGLTAAVPLAVLTAVSSAMHRDAELFAVVSTRITAPLQAASLHAFTAAVARGELPAHTDIELMSRVLPALALHQVFLLHEPLTTPRIAYLLDTVVLPACRTAAVA